eukprot:2653178-Amphidinium_carterae.1
MAADRRPRTAAAGRRSTSTRHYPSTIHGLDPKFDGIRHTCTTHAWFGVLIELLGTGPAAAASSRRS